MKGSKVAFPGMNVANLESDSAPAAKGAVALRQVNKRGIRTIFKLRLFVRFQVAVVVVNVALAVGLRGRERKTTPSDHALYTVGASQAGESAATASFEIANFM